MENCKFCSHESENLLEINEVISHCSWGWGQDFIKINLTEAIEGSQKLSIFVDRGFLRVVNLEDGDCLDHGEKTKINFCPMCGRKL